MSSAMVKIHEDLWPTYQMCSMDLLNQILKESKLLSQRDIQSQELDRQKQLDDRQKQLDDKQKQLDSVQQHVKVQQQQQLQQQLIFQQPQQQQQQYTVTQMPPPPASVPRSCSLLYPITSRFRHPEPDHCYFPDTIVAQYLWTVCRFII